MPRNQAAGRGLSGALFAALALGIGAQANALTVVLGASYASGWPIESIAGDEVVNRGIGGDETGDMVARFDDDVLAIAPDTVLIWGFINDVFRSDAASMEETFARIESNLADMTERAAERGMEVVLATEVTIREPKGFVNMLAGIAGRLLGKTSYQTYINGHVMEMNRRLRAFAAARNLRVLDFEDVLAAEGGERRAEYAVDDGSHLSPAAYDALTSYTESVLSAGPD